MLIPLLSLDYPFYTSSTTSILTISLTYSTYSLSSITTTSLLYTPIFDEVIVDYFYEFCLTFISINLLVTVSIYAVYSIITVDMLL